MRRISKGGDASSRTHPGRPLLPSDLLACFGCPGPQSEDDTTDFGSASEAETAASSAAASERGGRARRSDASARVVAGVTLRRSVLPTIPGTPVAATGVASFPLMLPPPSPPNPQQLWNLTSMPPGLSPGGPPSRPPGPGFPPGLQLGTPFATLVGAPSMSPSAVFVRDPEGNPLSPLHSSRRRGTRDPVLDLARRDAYPVKVGLAGNVVPPQHMLDPMQPVKKHLSYPEFFGDATALRGLDHTVPVKKRPTTFLLQDPPRLMPAATTPR